MAFLDTVTDHFEMYKIMMEVFYEYIPEPKKVKALSQASERINYEIKKARKI